MMKNEQTDRRGDVIIFDASGEKVIEYKDVMITNMDILYPVMRINDARYAFRRLDIVFILGEGYRVEFEEINAEIEIILDDTEA